MPLIDGFEGYDQFDQRIGEKDAAEAPYGLAYNRRAKRAPGPAL